MLLRENTLMPSKNKQTVESFALRLEGWDELIKQAQPVERLEAELLSRLENPVRVLRWAVVKVECDTPESRFRCEGAYLAAKR